MNGCFVLFTKRSRVRKNFCEPSLYLVACPADCKEGEHLYYSINTSYVL